jgi:isochorismate synthase
MRLSAVLKSGYPFAIWSLPNSNSWKGIAQLNTILDTSITAAAEGFIISSYKREDPPVLIRSDIEITTLDSDDYIFANDTNTSLPHEITKDEYLLQCSAIIEKIKLAKAEKVVLSRVKIQETRLNAVDVFKKLLENYSQAMVFMYSLGAEIWLGASPETLLEVDAKNYKTMALAGSKAVRSSRKWTKKEIDEQAYVEAYIEDILEKRKLTFHKTGPDTIEAGPVSHLKSEYFGELKDNDILGLLNDLHPTPAVCGIPLKNALEIIDQTEGHERLFYAGYIGPFTHHQASIFVNLRSAMFVKQKMYLFLGGGITIDSNPEEEWEETELKAETMLSIL